MAKPYQLNISPTEETLKMIDAAVEKYSRRHRGARNRAVLAAEVVNLYLPAFLELLAKQDKVLESHLSEGKSVAASPAPARRASRA